MLVCRAGGHPKAKLGGFTAPDVPESHLCVPLEATLQKAAEGWVERA